MLGVPDHVYSFEEWENLKKQQAEAKQAHEKRMYEEALEKLEQERKLIWEANKRARMLTPTEHAYAKFPALRDSDLVASSNLNSMGATRLRAVLIEVSQSKPN